MSRVGMSRSRIVELKKQRIFDAKVRCKLLLACLFARPLPEGAIEIAQADAVFPGALAPSQHRRPRADDRRQGKDGRVTVIIGLDCFPP